MRTSLPRFLHAMNERLCGKRYINGHELTIADFALGSLFLQTVCNEYNPEQETFMAEFQGYENLVQFVKHFNDDNLRYIESMAPSFF